MSATKLLETDGVQEVFLIAASSGPAAVAKRIDKIRDEKDIAVNEMARRMAATGLVE